MMFLLGVLSSAMGPQPLVSRQWWRPPGPRAAQNDGRTESGLIAEAPRIGDLRLPRRQRGLAQPSQKGSPAGTESRRPYTPPIVRYGVPLGRPSAGLDRPFPEPPGA